MNNNVHSVLVYSVLKGMERQFTAGDSVFRKSIFLDRVEEMLGEPIGASSDDEIRNRIMLFVVFNVLHTDADVRIVSAVRDRDYRRLIPILEDHIADVYVRTFERSIKHGSAVWQPLAHRKVVLMSVVDACSAYMEGDDRKLGEVLAEVLCRQIDPIGAFLNIVCDRIGVTNGRRK